MRKRIAEIGHDAESIGTVIFIFLDQAIEEKNLAPPDAVVRDRTGCISSMAIWQHVGMASTSRQKNYKKAIIRCTEMKGETAGTLVYICIFLIPSPVYVLLQCNPLC